MYFCFDMYKQPNQLFFLKIISFCSFMQNRTTYTSDDEVILRKKKLCRLMTKRDEEKDSFDSHMSLLHFQVINSLFLNKLV